MDREFASSRVVRTMISVQRFEPRMVPKCCWLDLALHESLYNMYGAAKESRTGDLWVRPND